MQHDLKVKRERERETDRQTHTKIREVRKLTMLFWMNNITNIV